MARALPNLCDLAGGVGDPRRSAKTVCYTVDEDPTDRNPSFAQWAPVTAAATDFVTLHLLESDSTLSQMRLVQTVHDALEATVETFRASHGLSADGVHFLFKGGNVMRFVVHAIGAGYPTLLAEVQKHYLGVFKTSDLDFGIVIAPDRLPPDVHITPADVHGLTRAVEQDLKRLRDRLVRSPSMIGGLSSSAAVVREQLAATFAAMRQAAANDKQDGGRRRLPGLVGLRCMDHALTMDPSAHTRADASHREALSLAPPRRTMLTPPVVRKDMSIRFADEASALRQVFAGGAPGAPEPQRMVCESTEAANMMYVSRNESLAFRKGDSTPPVHFDLARVKLAFEVDTDDGRTKKIGGEVIDVAIPHVHPQDQKFPEFVGLDFQRIPTYRTYSVRALDTAYSIESYSLPGLVYDLLKVLFLLSDNPWDDNKYAKRLTRIMGLLLCEALVELTERKASPKTLQRIMRACVAPPKAVDLSQRFPGTLWAFVQTTVGKVRARPPSEELHEMERVLDELAHANASMITAELARSHEAQDPYQQTHLQ